MGVIHTLEMAIYVLNQENILKERIMKKRHYLDLYQINIDGIFFTFKACEIAYLITA